MDSTTANITTKQVAPMHQQTSRNSRLNDRPLQLRERGYGEEESELALAPLILQLFSQRLEALRLNKQTKHFLDCDLLVNISAN